MNIPMPCSKCIELNPESSEVIPSVLRDDCTYDVQCTHGHKTRVMFLMPKFEVLFFNGSNALEFGFMREAVSSYAASVERFCEFFLRVNAQINKVDQAEFDKTWKQLSRQSERQLGAFVFAYLNLFSVAPVMPGKLKAKIDYSNFRNNVIHKGYIPSQSEAERFKELTISFIKPKIHQLQEKYPEQVVSVINNQYGDTPQEGVMKVFRATELEVCNPCALELVSQYMKNIR